MKSHLLSLDCWIQNGRERGFASNDNCPSLNKKEWNGNDYRKYFVTNFNIRMALDWKSQPIAA